MLIKIGNSYYNDDYLAKLFAIDDGRYVIQYYNGFRQVLSAEEYAEVAEKYKVILNGEYWLNTDKIERVFSDDEKMVVEFKNGNPTAAKNETVEKMVEGWYQVGDYYYNPKYIIRLNEFDGSYFVQFTNGQTKKISEEEYEAILAIPQGPVTEEKTVALNMADGNQVIEKSADVDGMTKVTVEKPATLISANIKSGVNIGGVDGSLEFLTETKTVALDMASGDQVVAKSEDKDGMTEVTIEKPVTFVAENIKKDVDIGGVVGTYDVTLGTKTITQNGTYPASDDGLDGFSSVEVNVSGGGVDHGGKYHVVVVDYDGTVLKQDHLNEGATFELPEVPTSHNRLRFQEWSSPVDITNNQITIPNNDIIIGAVYTTVSGLNEVDISLNKQTGKEITFDCSGTIDWGDGTSSTRGSHTYSNYGNYTIKFNGTPAYRAFGQTNSKYNYTVVNAHIVTQLPNGFCEYLGSIKTITYSREVIGQYGFSPYNMYARLLKCIIIPTTATTLAQNVAFGCYNLKYVAIPKTIVGLQSYSIFSTDYALEYINIGNLSSSPTGSGQLVGSLYCLKRLTVPVGLSTIGANRFANSYNIMEYDFTKFQSVPTLSDVSAFSSINDLCKIIVPDALYETWIAESNWVTYANYIYKKSEV